MWVNNTNLKKNLYFKKYFENVFIQLLYSACYKHWFLWKLKKEHTDRQPHVRVPLSTFGNGTKNLNNNNIRGHFTQHQTKQNLQILLEH